MKNDKAYTPRYGNPENKTTLPVAGIILNIQVDNWIHPYYGMSKHFEQKSIQVEVATIKWFEYNIPELGESDLYNLEQYNKNYNKMPTSRLSNFNNYVEGLKKKKELYK